MSGEKWQKVTKGLALVSGAGCGTVGQRCAADTVVHAAGKGASGQLSSWYSSFSVAKGEALLFAKEALSHYIAACWCVSACCVSDRDTSCLFCLGQAHIRVDEALRALRLISYQGQGLGLTLALTLTLNPSITGTWCAACTAKPLVAEDIH